jgi:quinol monooxygenase YgiN
MIVILGTLRFPPSNMARVRPHLQRLVMETRAHDGCVSYDVAEDLFDPGLIRYSEEWPDQAALDRHLTAPQIGVWRDAIAGLGVSDRKFTVYAADEGRIL